MSVNIEKLIDASLFFLLKDGRPFSKKRLNCILMMADLNHMESHIIGITDDVINSLPSGPKLHLATQIFNGYMFTEQWRQHFISTNDNQLLIKHSRLPFSLNAREKEALKQVFAHYGDLDEQSISYILQSKGMDWHENGSTKFNPFLFFKSLGFTDAVAKEHQEIYFDHMSIDRSSINDFFDRYNQCEESLVEVV